MKFNDFKEFADSLAISVEELKDIIKNKCIERNTCFTITDKSSFIKIDGSLECVSTVSSNFMLFAIRGGCFDLREFSMYDFLEEALEIDIVDKVFTEISNDLKNSKENAMIGLYSDILKSLKGLEERKHLDGVFTDKELMVAIFSKLNDISKSLEKISIEMTKE